MSRPLADLIGREVAGRYRIVRPLGQGGTGAVFEAEALGGGAPVAIKVLLPGAEGAADAAERLRRGPGWRACSTTPHRADPRAGRRAGRALPGDGAPARALGRRRAYVRAARRAAHRS